MRAAVPSARLGLAVLGASVVGVVLLSVAGRLLGPAQDWRPEPYVAPPLTDRPPPPVDTGSAPSDGDAEHGVVREDISVPVRGDELAATVFAPDAPGSYPAVAFVHGAGAGDRSSFFGLAERFARAGIVAVAYDKRSDYSYFDNRDFDQLAEDASAVVAVMRDRSDVDPERAGLWGLSEGGRVVPLAASRDSGVAFVVTVGGAIRGPLRNTAWSVYEGLAAAGAPAGAGRLAVRILGGGHLFTLHLDPPTGVWAGVGQPALVIYGTNDYLVPPAESSRHIVDDLRRGGNTAHAVRFFDGADHGLRRDGDYAPGYVRTVTDWITGLPGSAAAAAPVAGPLPVQRYATTPVPRTPWYGGTPGLIATVLLTVVGALVVPAIVRRRLPAGAGECAAVLRSSRRAMRAGIAAYAVMWAYVGLTIGLGYTRNGGELLFQVGWGLVRAAGLLAVVAGAAAGAALLTARRHGWAPEGAQQVLLASHGAVAALMVLSVAYWGVFEPRW
ncbi:hypothetical protein E1262_02270 [Jiangella aurantiaca]|uniref:Alpha/beta hydrolase n=1 Tax=Jiangella aurantiaca TaxID=2530373 RepID=A0A4R5AJE9_9ACTN|nr:dienelactone hydrolase family protein [Jiangella aurantiaca]TDD72701.1 hypothetical protein E1262_02270 [Jiangella aurantiaca]